VKAQLVRNAIRHEGNFHVGFRNVTADQARQIAAHADVEDSCMGRIAGFAVIDVHDTVAAGSAAGGASEGAAGEASGAAGERVVPYRLIRLSENDTRAMEMLMTESRIEAGRLPRAEGEIAVDRRTLRFLGEGAGIGSSVTLPVGERRETESGALVTSFRYPATGKDGKPGTPERFIVTGERTFTITGILGETFHISNNYSSDADVWNGYEDLGAKDMINILVLLGNLRQVQATAERIAESAGVPSANIVYNEELLNMYGRGLSDNMNKRMALFNAVIVLIIAIATIAVIYNSFNISMIERVSQFGILRCVGATPRQIRRLIYREGLIIAGIGVPIGCACGILAMGIVFLVADALSSNLLFEDLTVRFSLPVVAASILTGVSTVLLSALAPALRAGRIPAIEAVRGTGMYAHERFVRPRRRAGVWKKRGFALTMAGRNIARNRKRFFVTMFSIVISVVLYVSFGGLLGLVRRTNVVNDPDLPGFLLESEAGIEASIYSDIRGMAEVETVFPCLEREVEMLVPEASLSPQYRSNVQDLGTYQKEGDWIRIPRCRILCYGNDAMRIMANSTVWGSTDPAEMNRTGGVILVETGSYINPKGIRSYAPRGTYEKGDLIHIAGDPLSPRRIIGLVREPLYDDFNEYEGGFDVVVTMEQFEELTGSCEYGKMMIKLEAGEGKERLVRYLDELVVRDPTYSYIDAQAVSETFTKDFDALSLFFYGFMAILALIGCINIVNTISTNLIVRTRELGIIQAVGMDGRGMGGMVYAEIACFGALSLVIGGALGSAAWFLLVSIVGGVRETVFRVPWREIGVAVVGVLVISMAAGYFPLKRIRGSTIVDKIRAEE
jgi:putative ABC transport system permease protein